MMKEVPVAYLQFKKILKNENTDFLVKECNSLQRVQLVKILSLNFLSVVKRITL